MAVMMIQSSDPNFSLHIKKNPASVLAVKRMRQGTLSGWFPKGQTDKYCLYFRDENNKSSFTGDKQVNYTDLTRYASTYFVFHSISVMFSSVLKLDQNQEVYNHSIHIPTVQFRSENTIKYLNNFLNLDIKYDKISENLNSMALYKVNINYNGSFNEFMMKVYVLFYMLHADLHEGDLQFMQEMVAKVTNILIQLKSEYFLWYIFNKNIINNRSLFNKLKDSLGKDSADGIIDLKYGSTQIQRKDFIDSKLPFNKSILEIGCGEGLYTLSYAKKLKDNKIYAIDVDAEILEKLNSKVIDRNLTDKVELLPNIDSFIQKNNDELLDIICVEVIEHMPIEDAKELINLVLTKTNFESFIITTPNIEFNVFYKTLNGFRHDDHHFEFNQNEFKSFINECVSKVDNSKFTITFEDVGDVVNGIPMSQSVTIKRNMESVQ